MLLLAYLHVSSAAISGDLDRYWQTGSLRAVSAILILAPAGAACAAWEVGRLRQGGVFASPAVRSSARAVTRALTPILLVGVAGLAIALGVVLDRMRASVGGPDPRVLAMGVAVLVGHLSIGAVAGRFLARVVATPLCLVVSYLWLVLPTSMLPFSIRHLTGFDTNCCQLDATVAPWGVLGPVVVATGCALASVAALFARPTALGVALVIAASSVTIALHGVGTFGVDPVRLRPAGGLVCDGREPVVCVWPEHRAALPGLVTAADSLRRRLDRLGIAVPPRASEARTDRTRWIFAIRAGSPADVRAASLASGLVPSDGPLCHAPQSWQGGAAVPLLQAWLQAQTGIADEQVAAAHAPQLINVLNAVRSEPAEVQAAWYQANYLAATHCDVRATLTP